MLSEHRELLDYVSVFSGLSQEGLNTLVNHKATFCLRYPKGFEFDPDEEAPGFFAILLEGCIRFEVCGNIHRHVVRELIAGDVITDEEFVEAIRGDVSFVLSESSLVLFVPTACLKDLSEDDANIVQTGLKNELVETLVALMHDLALLSIPRLSDRVMKYLSQLPEDEDGFRYIPLTRIELATQLSIAEKSLIRILRELGKEGLIIVDGRRVFMAEDTKKL